MSGRPWSVDEIERMRALFAAGRGEREVARQLGRAHTSVRIRRQIEQIAVSAPHYKHETLKTRCHRGHDLTDPANVYTRTDRAGHTQRNCRACRRIRQRTYTSTEYSQWR